MHDGYIVRNIRHVLNPVRHRQADFHDIAFLPFAVDGDIRRRGGIHSHGLAIDGNSHRTGLEPSGATDIYLELALTGNNGKLGTFLGRESGILAYDYLPVLPIQLRCHEQVDVQIIIYMGIDESPVFGLILHARSYTAPHGFVRDGIDAVMPWPCGGEIDVSTMHGMLR